MISDCSGYVHFVIIIFEFQNDVAHTRTHARTAHAQEKRQQVSITVSSSLSFVCVPSVFVVAVCSSEWLCEIDFFFGCFLDQFCRKSLDCREFLFAEPETFRQPPLRAQCLTAVCLRLTITRRYPAVIDSRSTIRTGPSYH